MGLRWVEERAEIEIVAIFFPDVGKEQTRMR